LELSDIGLLNSAASAGRARNPGPAAQTTVYTHFSADESLPWTRTGRHGPGYTV